MYTSFNMKPKFANYLSKLHKITRTLQLIIIFDDNLSSSVLFEEFHRLHKPRNCQEIFIVCNLFLIKYRKVLFFLRHLSREKHKILL